METLMQEILEELLIELELDANNEEDTKSIDILKIKLKNAMREVKQAFNFKDYHSEEFVLQEMTSAIANIKALAIYDYVKVGAEHESSHSEKNISRNYTSRQECFSGIVRFAD